MNRLLEQLERRFGRHTGIRNLMAIISVGILIVYLADLCLPGIFRGASLSQVLCFDKTAIMRGEVWRLLTFVFVPMSGSLILLVFSLSFYWILGEQLQNAWGTFRFTLFYTVGMLGTVLSGCLTGYATSYYLNMSVLLAMAVLQPDLPMRLYGLIQLRLKWFALISLGLMLLPVVRSGSWRDAAAITVALVNVLLFLADHLLEWYRRIRRRQQWRQNWRSGWKR